MCSTYAYGRQDIDDIGQDHAENYHSRKYLSRIILFNDTTNIEHFTMQRVFAIKPIWKKHRCEGGDIE